MLILTKNINNIKISEDIKKDIKLISFDDFKFDFLKDENTCYIFLDGNYCVNSIPMNNFDNKDKIIFYCFGNNRGGQNIGPGFYLVSSDFLQFVYSIFGKDCFENFNEYIEDVIIKPYTGSELTFKIKNKDELKKILDNYFENKKDIKTTDFLFFLNAFKFCEDEEILDYGISLIFNYFKEEHFNKYETCYPLPIVSQKVAEKIKDKIGYYIGLDK